MRRARQRIIALAIVGASGLAAANIGGGGPHVSANPPVTVVRIPLPAGSNVSGGMMLMNDGDQIAQIQSFDQDVAICTNASIQGSGAPQTIAVGGAGSAAVVCPALITPIIDRCHFLMHDAAQATTYGAFTALCVYEGGSVFAPQGSLAVNFPDTPVGGMSAPQTVMMMNAASSLALLSIQIADQDGNFEVGSPCTNSGPGCNATIAVPPSSQVGVQFICTPKSPGPHTATAWVVGDNGTHLATPYTLSCTGQAGGGPTIASDKPSVSLGTAVGMSTSTVVTISNAGSAGSLDLHISAITVMGSTWSVTPGAPCASGSCTLAPQASAPVTVTYTSTDFVAQTGTLAVSSDDPMTPTLNIPLTGSGSGATLEMASNLGMPPTLPIVSPIGMAGSASFQITNNGNAPLAPVVAMLTQPGSNYSVQAPTMIPANVPQTVTVTCTPGSTATVHAQLDISSPSALHNTSPLPTIDVPCTGTTGNLKATPGSLMFGEVRTNDGTTSLPIMLHSTGGTLTLGDPTLVMSVAGMSLGPLSSHSVPPDATFSVVVAPTGDGDLANTVMATASDSSNIPIPITGQVTTASFTVPETVEAGAFCVGGATSPTAIALRSTGTGSIVLDQPVLVAAAQSAFQLDDTLPGHYPFPLPAQQSAMIAITPRRQDHAGPQSDVIQWATDVPGQLAPQTAINAQFVADGGAIAPQMIDFGSLPLREPATDQIVTLRNCGTESMDLSPAVIAPPGGDFHDTSTMALPMTLAPNQTATVSVGFEPTRPGLSTGTLTVASSKGELGVALVGRGTGLDRGPRTSFYACGCQSRSSDPSGVLPIVLAAAWMMRRRRVA